MPNTICEECRLIMDYCYRFKQMCKKSDTVLKQFPLTGIFPNKQEHPKYPEEIAEVCFIIIYFLAISVTKIQNQFI